MNHITEQDVRNATGLDYWRLRYERHHVKVPGTSNKHPKEQRKEYNRKKSFIKKHINVDPGDLVLDYGCGIGHYAGLFNCKRYLGYDPVKKAVELARKQNTSYTFTHIEPTNIKLDTVLMFTVLQHIKYRHWPFGIMENTDKLYVFENTSDYPDKSYIYFRNKYYYINNIPLNCVNTWDYLHEYTDNIGNIRKEIHTLFEFKR